MINPLDDVLRDLVQSRVPGLAGPTQVGFAPPNTDWKAAVVGAAEERVNFYLYDLRENTRLRTNEITAVQRDRIVSENLPSPRLDCTYLITAWSPVAFTPLLDPTREEHAILYNVLAALMLFRPLAAADVYAKPNPLGHVLAGVPVTLREQPLPAAVAPPDAVKEPAEFWTTMKVDSRPAIRLTITIPVVLDQPDVDYAAVTTLTGVYAQAGVAAATESLATIGGRVLRGPVATAVPVARAAVRLRHAAPSGLPGPDKRAVTDTDGRFTFAGIPAGGYELLVIAGSDFTAQTIDVPSPGGQYDVRLP